MSHHVLKVIPPYFDALADGSKTFEVRKNDRAYQRGDTLTLWEFKPDNFRVRPCERFPCDTCKPRSVERLVTFVYGGDPRFGGIEPGTVVLALTTPDPATPTRAETPADRQETI